MEDILKISHFHRAGYGHPTVDAVQLSCNKRPSIYYISKEGEG